MRDTEPVLHPVKIADLRPTQMTVGLREVGRKRHQWRERAERDGPEFLGRHMIPVVRGPKNRLWIIDAHHLARALHDEGVEHVLAQVIADLGGLSDRAFKTYMDSRCWFHPFGADGKRQPLKAIPLRLVEKDFDKALVKALKLARGGRAAYLPGWAGVQT